MRELDRQNDRFFQGLLCIFQTGNILPLNIRLVGQNSSLECRPELLRVRIFTVIVLFFAVPGPLVS